MKRMIYKIIVGIFLLVVALSAAVFGYLQLPMFGSVPEGARLERIMQSPNYRDGEFRNLDPIPPQRGNVVQGWTRMLFAKKDRPKPDFAMPTVKTNLHGLSRDDDMVIWLGHASYFIQSGGKRYLVDPVFNSHASPLPFINRAFDGTCVYTPEDMPKIDYLLITHDHWDHLDYQTVRGLKDKIAAVIVPLGVGAHFERWGFPAERVRELDWGEAVALDATTTIHALPTLHYSARKLTRNKTLWAAYALIRPEFKLYLSGDSGYGSHFKAAGEAFGGFDFAVLDSGQYNENWRWVHMMPEDTVMAANDLNAKVILPVHMGKFSMAYHSWDDPFIRMEKAAEGQKFTLIMPIPGEIVSLDSPRQYVSGWWKRAGQK